jgi:multicomponent Na+:H+ antiporter subunit G
MSTVDLISGILLIAGAAMSMLAGVAVLRFPDTRTRVHAATKPQVLGIMLLMLGLGLRLGTWAVAGQLVLIVILQFLTAPVSAHLVVRAAHREATKDEADGAVDDPATGPTGGTTAEPADGAAAEPGNRE